MELIGKFPRFYSRFDDWQLFIERLESLFEINDIFEEKKTAHLITAIDERAYQALRDLCEPMLPKNKTFEEL